MQRKSATFTLSLLLFTVTIFANGQQKASGEFVSPIGQFGVMLPPTSLNYFNDLSFKIGDDTLIACVFNWRLDSDEAVIIYAVGRVDLETKADFYLETLRDKYAAGSIISQKKTSFAGHPGLVSVVDSNTRSRGVSRAMVWTYLLKNRVYLMSLTLDDKSRIEEHLKLMSTFRLLSPKDMEPRLTALVDELTPEPLPQTPAQSRPTTDAQDAALKGRVKSVITESEAYVDGSLFGAREMFSDESYDDHGNLVKTVDYRNSLPFRVRLYGTHKGERAFREIRKVRRSVDYRDKNDSGEKEIKSEPRVFTIEHKHDRDGQLLQTRVLRDGSKEIETTNYNLKAKTVTHRYGSEYIFVRHLSPTAWSVKMVSTLDASGNSIEDAYQLPNGITKDSRFDYSPIFGFTFFDRWDQRYRTDKERHEYVFDDRGNWIQRKTFSLTKDKERVPNTITYRTIIYYQ